MPSLRGHLDRADNSAKSASYETPEVVYEPAELVPRRRNRLWRVVVAWRRRRLVVHRRRLLDVHRLRLDVNRLLHVDRRLGVGDDRAYDEPADHGPQQRRAPQPQPPR